MPNTAQSVRDVWISGDGALDLADHFEVVIGAPGMREATGRIVFATPSGEIIVRATPESLSSTALRDAVLRISNDGRASSPA